MTSAPLSLSASTPLNTPSPLCLQYSGSFPETDPNPCPICLDETPPKSYQICANHHTLCHTCLTALFNSTTKNLPIVNLGLGSPNTLYVDQEALSKCPIARCPLSINLKIESSDSSPPHLIWINYMPGDQIQLSAHDFEETTATLYGRMVDGTVAFLQNVPSLLAYYFIQTTQPIHTQILGKSLNEKSDLYLKCSSTPLYTLTAKIDSIDQETGAPAATSTLPIRINFHGSTASVGDTVSGYFHSEDDNILNCTPYQIGQKIVFTISNINLRSFSWRLIKDEVCGWLDNEKTLVEFFPDPAKGGSGAYRLGDRVEGIVQKIHAPVETEPGRYLVILDCGPEGYALNDSSSLSFSSSSSYD